MASVSNTCSLYTRAVSILTLQWGHSCSAQGQTEVDATKDVSASISVEGLTSRELGIWGWVAKYTKFQIDYKFLEAQITNQVGTRRGVSDFYAGGKRFVSRKKTISLLSVGTSCYQAISYEEKYFVRLSIGTWGFRTRIVEPEKMPLLGNGR